MGFLLDPLANMDLPPECHCWAYVVPNSRRRDIFLCNSDIQYVVDLSTRE